MSGEDAWAVSFCMFPVTVEQVMKVADAEQLMPPKVGGVCVYLALWCVCFFLCAFGCRFVCVFVCFFACFFCGCVFGVFLVCFFFCVFLVLFWCFFGVCRRGVVLYLAAIDVQGGGCREANAFRSNCCHQKSPQSGMILCFFVVCVLSRVFRYMLCLLCVLVWLVFLFWDFVCLYVCISGICSSGVQACTTNLALRPSVLLGVVYLGDVLCLDFRIFGMC